MSGTAYTILGAISAGIAFLLGAQAAGAAGIEALPPIVWLLIGAANAGLSFIIGLKNRGT